MAVALPGARVDRMVRGITLGPKHGLPMRVRLAEGPPAPPPPCRVTCISW